MSDAKTVGLKVRKIYKKTDMKGKCSADKDERMLACVKKVFDLLTHFLLASFVIAHTIDTEDKSWHLLGGKLYYVHFLLYTLCTYFRMFRNVVNWKCYTSYKLTMMSFYIGTLWLILPMHMVFLWFCRIVVWTLLGPWIKLVDIFYIHKNYRTKNELMEDPVFHGTNLESLWLTSDSVRKMGVSARVASEEALKLKAMRECRFGKLSQLIPAVDTSRFASTPLPESTAVPYAGPPNRRNANKTDVFVDLPAEQQEWRYVPGQKLEGHMIHKRLKRSEAQQTPAAQENGAL
jgi:hypothetical protein